MYCKQRVCYVNAVNILRFTSKSAARNEMNASSHNCSLKMNKIETQEKASFFVKFNYMDQLRFPVSEQFRKKITHLQYIKQILNHSRFTLKL